MTEEVVVADVGPRLLAAVRRHVHVGEVGQVWKPALDQVWAFLRRSDDLWSGGHNVFLYHHPADRGDPMAVDFGVEVGRSFEPHGEVRPTPTPAGEVASATHHGPYDRLIESHDAIHRWAAANGREFAGLSWEIYSDPGPDPASLEVQVVYLLA